jgi:protoporphyrin/coproporphyrin ferrochelatase
VTSRNVQTKLQQRVAAPVELAMRYQNPPIAEAVLRLAQRGVDDLLVIPLFPHYAMSSYETAVERVREATATRMRVRVQPPYFDHPDYIAALVASAERFLKVDYDHLLFSFHGLPERHIRKSDPTGCHCLTVANCCETPSPAHDTCYRAQCLKTVAAFVERAKVPKERYSIAFQSRLGRHPWLKPYTDFELPRLASLGVRKLLVMCPAFVADCLETLEEIGLRGRESFVDAGGAELTLIPCLNEQPLWLDTLDKMVDRFTRPTPTQAAVVRPG